MNTRTHQPLTLALAVIIACAIVLSLAPAAAAQDQTAPVPPRHRRAQALGQQPGTDAAPAGRHGFPRGPGFGFLGSEMRFGDKTVTGAPFSAQVETESTQTLADGTHSSHKGTGAIYRDSQGRTRREMAPGFFGRFGSTQDPPQMVFISDPVASAHYVLDSRNLTARKMTPPAPRAPQGTEEVQKLHRQSQFDVKTESLGSQTIEGVVAQGTRSVITIPAGTYGNDNAMQIISERWDSAELQTTVLSKHSDPWMGEHTYRLTHITRDEPAQSLFEVPANYTVQEGGFGPGGRGRGPRRPNQN